MSIFVAATLFTVYAIIEGRYRILARVEVADEAQFIMARIKWLLTGIDGVNQPLPNSTSSLLSVNKSNFSENPVVVFASGTDVFFSYGGKEWVLNSESVIVNELIFEHKDFDGNPAVEIRLSVGFRPREQLTIYPASTSLHTTIYGRK